MTTQRNAPAYCAQNIFIQNARVVCKLILRFTLKQDLDEDNLEQLAEPAKKRGRGQGLMDLLFIAVPLLIGAFGYHAFSNQATSSGPVPLQQSPQTSNYEVPASDLQKSQYDAKALDCGYHINAEIHRYRFQHKNDLSMPDFDTLLKKEWRGEDCTRKYGFNTSFVASSPLDYTYSISHKNGSVVFNFNSFGLIKK